jgi:hypothetical protein
VLFFGSIFSSTEQKSMMAAQSREKEKHLIASLADAPPAMIAQPHR